MIICPSCRKPVDDRLTRCPWDGTLLASVALDPLLGTALGGRYLLRRCIGERDRIKLYTAEEKATGRSVLATVISSSRGEDPGAAERFRRRVEQGRALDHPSCTVVRDYGLLGATRAYVIEEGEVWHQLSQELVVKGGRLPFSRALDLTIQLVEGLDHMHAKGLYNTHISTACLRLVFDAKGALNLQIPTAEVIGHLLEDERADQAEPSEGLAEDLAAAAQVLGEMLTGSPFDQDATFDVATSGLESDASAKLRKIMERALGLAGVRFGSAWEMRRELESVTGRSRLGRYTLLHRIAVGGMGEIFLARAEGIEGLDLNRLCVIKTIRTHLVQSAAFVERFLAEARVLASLSHGNIVPVHDVGKVGSVFYIAMEYVAGKDLRKILSRAAKQKLRMSVPLALFIAKELANGLAYAHRAKVQGTGGLVHRDVSPHNTLVSYEGEVKLIDFGLAQAGGGLQNAGDDVVMGKACYISPEQSRAEPLDQRTDIYSAGLVLFELLTGEPFFNQPTIDEVLKHVGKPAVEPPSARASDIPPEVDRICLRAMAPRREDRYLTAGAMRDDLTAELARIAPRTNPEEVGQFVRSLFSTEQRDEEILISDLSMTIPPYSLERSPDSLSAATASVGEPSAATESSGALSLLGRTPLPIQLASTFLDERQEAPPQSAPAAVPEARPEVGDAGYKSDEPSVLTQQVRLVEPPSWRAPFLIGVVIAIVGGGGVLGGFWLSSARTDASRAAERAALKALAAWGKNAATEREASAPPAPAPTPAVRSDSGRAPSVKRHLKPAVKPVARGGDPCLVEFIGGAGLELTLDGKPVPGRLPLPKPLSISPGEHHIVVRGPGLQPYRQQVRCASGGVFKIKLHKVAL